MSNPTPTTTGPKASTSKSLFPRVPFLTKCSRKPSAASVREESFAETAGSSASSSCSDLSVLEIQAPVPPPPPSQLVKALNSQAAKPLQPAKAESKPFLFREKRLALRTFTATIKENVQVAKARLEEVREDPEYELGLLALADLFIPLTVTHQPGEHPPAEHSPTDTVAGPGSAPKEPAQSTERRASQPSNGDLKKPLTTEAGTITPPEVADTPSKWKTIKSAILRSRNVTLEIPPQPTLDVVETTALLHMAMEEEHDAKQTTLCTSAMLKLEFENLLLVALVWLLITFLGYLSRWRLLVHIWFMAYALALCWSQIKALYLVPMQFAHGPFSCRLPSIQRLSPEVQALLTFSYWTCRLARDSEALLEMWPEAKEHAKLRYCYPPHQHRKRRSKVGWYRAMSLTCWILRILAFCAVHYLFCIFAFGWTTGNARFSISQYHFLAVGVAVKICKWIIELARRQEDVVYWQEAGLEKEKARRLRRLRKEVESGTLPEDKLAMLRGLDEECPRVCEEPKQVDGYVVET